MVAVLLLAGLAPFAGSPRPLQAAASANVPVFKQVFATPPAYLCTVPSCRLDHPVAPEPTALCDQPDRDNNRCSDGTKDYGIDDCLPATLAMVLQAIKNEGRIPNAVVDYPFIRRTMRGTSPDAGLQPPSFGDYQPIPKAGLPPQFAATLTPTLTQNQLQPVVLNDKVGLPGNSTAAPRSVGPHGTPSSRLN